MPSVSSVPYTPTAGRTGSSMRADKAFGRILAHDQKLHGADRRRAERVAAAERLSAFKTLASVARQIVHIADTLEAIPDNHAARTMDQERHDYLLSSTFPDLGQTLTAQLELLVPLAPARAGPLDNIIKRTTDTLVAALNTADHVIVIFPEDANAELAKMSAVMHAQWALAVDVRQEHHQLSFHRCGDRWACPDEADIELIFLDLFGLSTFSHVALWLPPPRTMASWWAQWTNNTSTKNGEYTTTVDITVFLRKGGIQRNRLQFE